MLGGLSLLLCQLLVYGLLEGHAWDLLEEGLVGLFLRFLLLGLETLILRVPLLGVAQGFLIGGLHLEEGGLLGLV